VAFKGLLSASVCFSGCHFALCAARHISFAIICLYTIYIRIETSLASSHFIEGDKIKGRRRYAEIMRIRLQPRGKEATRESRESRKSTGARERRRKRYGRTPPESQMSPPCDQRAFAFIPQATPRHFEIQSRRRRPQTKSRVAHTHTHELLRHIWTRVEFSRLIAGHEGRFMWILLII
jgi:hypothetical protein